MTCVDLGGSGGSWLGVRIYGRAGWPGVCALVAGLAAVALARHLVALSGRGPDARQAGDGGRGGPMHVGIGRPPTVPRLSKQPVERRAL
ncbi:hypothetical protein ACIF8W_01135 [Streptomyces sp. NPDC085639]|uniref:hypothetical protein n=1 Tax=Streptomyces sp. NPDC085639 TaxID=3365734 RepID=UPI0037CD44F7